LARWQAIAIRIGKRQDRFKIECIAGTYYSRSNFAPISDNDTRYTHCGL
jgi:hypothetical protein